MASTSTGGNKNLETLFNAYAKFGNAKNTEITLTNSDKWMKEAGIFNKTITTTDTGICFQKFKKKTLSFKEYMQFLEQLATDKKMKSEDIIGKMAAVKAPGTTGATEVAKSAVVDRMTDTSKYTGSHKERFDAEGKGKGKEGRVDEAKNEGYVQGYKQKDTYDKK